MKKRQLLVFFGVAFLVFISLRSMATVYIIGNDTIHKLNNNYYFIGIHDTILIDSTVITVQFIENTSLSTKTAFQSNHGLMLHKAFPTGSNQYRLSPGQNFISNCSLIVNDVNVEKLNIHFFMKLYGFEPDDDYTYLQWYLKNIGVYDYETGTGVWDITKGNSDVIIAVLDSGLDWDYAEFGPVNDNLDVVYHNPEDEWTIWNDPNSGNTIDEDGNGYFNDWKGWDFQHNDLNPPCGNNYSEDNDLRINDPENMWHGNAVTGIIAAKTNNAYGVAGIAGGNADNSYNGVIILPLKVDDSNYDLCILGDYISTADVESAIYYAISKGAKVINMSFGVAGVERDITPNLKEVIDFAYNEGITLIAAAGNHETYDPGIAYPAINDKVIAVGATNEDDNHCWFSNVGSEIDLAAPGENITIIANSGVDEYFFNGQGTSFSAPMVSATVGLMLSVNPYLVNGDWDTEGSIMNILKRTADKTGELAYVDGWNNQLGYGRLNTYKAVCMAIDYMPEIVVENDATWSDRVISSKDIIIEEGVKLTITGVVMMGEDAKIIVKPGAVLSIDGGTITNIPFCENDGTRWAGIEVWGNSNDNQFEYSGHPLAQGMLKLTSATIENASQAIRTYKFAEWGTKAGGIVIAENSIFINNLSSVSIFPFKNNAFNNEYDYRASFINCVFSVDDEFSENNYNYDFITLWGVKGIKISGCVFENKLDVLPSGMAINSLDAGFSIKGICSSEIAPCPTVNFQNTTFFGFRRAILANTSQNQLYQILIRDAEFTHNGYGVSFRGVNDAIVIDNSFELGIYDDCEVSGSTGIYLDNCKRFAVENNSFTLDQPADAITNIGIHTINTNNAYDEIYNNFFDNMIVANYAVGKNWNLDNRTGLAYYCNSNQNNEYDFYVAENNEIPDDGIQRFQGNSNYVAGNTFSSTATGHFFNFGDYNLDYYYDENVLPETPDDNLLKRVTSIKIDLSNTCPVHYSGGDIRLSTIAFQQCEAAFSTAFNSFNNATKQYDSLSLLNDTSSLSFLAEQIAYHNMNWSRSAYDIVRSDLADTLSHSTQFINWLNEMGTFGATESLVDVYLQKGQYSLAMNEIDSLRFNFDFSDFDEDEFSYYRELKDIQVSALNGGRDIFELNANELNTLASIATNSLGLAGAQAKGILEFAYGNTYSFINCVRLADTTLKKTDDFGMVNNNQNGFDISMKPNPASEIIEFTYTLPEDCEQGIFSLFNTNSKIVYTLVLDKPKDNVRFDCSHLSPGVYYYSVSCSDVIKTGKVIIIR